MISAEKNISWIAMLFKGDSIRNMKIFVQEKLFEMQDEGYREFHARLMPTVDKDSIIGVRVPRLRKFAKELYKSGGYEDFLKALPHKYYEENNVHAFLIEQQKDYGETVRLLDEFLPYVDNWATCDMMSPKSFKKHLPELYEKIPEWLGSDKTYAVRFGIETLMNFFLGEDFTDGCASLVCSVRSDEYYINMMIAWYFATALAKNYEDVVPYIEGKRLDVWTHNKTIQKAVESNRITDEQKAYLRTLKIK